MMLRFLTILLSLGSLLATTPIHLKPGALTAQIGEVLLIEDVLLVKYPYTSLTNSTDIIRIVSEKLLGMADAIRATKTRESKAPSSTNSLTLFQLLEDRILFLRGKVDEVNMDYSFHSVHSRVKRGLLNIVGSASKFLFGTATDEDVRDLRDHYAHVLSFAARNRRVINANCRKLAQLHTNIEELLEQTNKMVEVINIVVKQIDQVNQFLLLDQALHVLENVINSVATANQQVISNMVDAAHGRVTPALFPLHDLRTTVQIGYQNYSLTPLFTPDMSQYFYPLIESSLTPDAIIIHVPFQTADVFEAHEIVPFHFSAKDSVLALDTSPSLVLIAKDFALYSTDSYSLLQYCKETVFGRFYCSASLFAFLPVRGGVCEIALTRVNASDALSLCPYKQLTPTPVFHQNFQGLHYFYFPQSFYVSVICPEGTTYQRVTGHYAIAEACYIRSTNITTYPSRIRLVFTANISHRVFPLRSLDDIHFSSISYVTNSLNSLSFANKTEFAETLEETLPDYLHLPYLYPGFFVPMFLMFVSLVVMCYLIRRNSVLHDYLVVQTRRLDAGRPLAR
ncbi:uncharacterized protein LOC126984255 isoform X1 [Eriocheir sinensis]|uniref:uncharacterized protein LOC126984255 isoform X1 n=1 Tax=Eriocheir sinensis TaxID=95602 RepID=UPI0021C97BF2|nr:uncharacterized protein LOC126984255 isoform X1 [Eriocheir sinensis]